MLLEGKVAIVTGIGPGLGREIALLYAREGADLAIAARHQERLAAVAGEIEALGRSVIAIATDITDRRACEALVEAALERFRRVDILVQNGHYDGDYKPLGESDPQDWRDILEVNLFGALHLVQAVIPSMRERGDGRIVLVNSGASTDPPPTLGAYAASKAALASLVRTIAVELGPDGIRANGIQLGPMDGENFRLYLEDLAAAAGRTYEEELAVYNEQFALRYTPTTEECAGTALFLASEHARPITGQSIAVNGGKWFLT
ncbi:MAG: SDR family NAD(P)-dependent oxidoreductase [bacterium]|nr:short-chain dehydrogenase [Deltaproteobacteria bacterium]MCP4904884.1 SDR family NAD(P)-dependent oxidoreductase [bacterium]